VVWGILTVVVSIWLGPRFILAFRPPENYFFDFLQEWLSAKNYLAGMPVFVEQQEAMFRHTGILLNEGIVLHWNAHPPGSVLITLPFGYLSYRDAHLLWNLLTFPLFLASLAIIVRELKVPLSPWSLLPAITLMLLFHPLYLHLHQGQLNIPVLFFITLAWWADRHGRLGWAGMALGIAAGVKLYPAFLFAYFLFTRRWLALVTGAITFGAINGITMAVLGSEAFRTYVNVVVPHLVNYQSSCVNVSLTGFWMRIFNPNPVEKVIAWTTQPMAATLLIWASRGVIAAAVVGMAWRSHSVATRDRAFATGIVGMLLVSPITWSHYFVLLLLPVTLLWMRWPGGWARLIMWLVLIPLWLPDSFFATLAIGPAQALAMAKLQHDFINPQANITFISTLTYTLVGLFLLTAVCPAREESVAPDSAA
jgi:hypothetical protein